MPSNRYFNQPQPVAEESKPVAEASTETNSNVIEVDLSTSHAKIEGRKRFGNQKMQKKNKDRFPGPVPVDKERLKTFNRGSKPHLNAVRTGFHRHQLKKENQKVFDSIRSAARSNLLLNHQSGSLEVEEDEATYNITQTDIRKSVDITSASKGFDLTLNEFGPYKFSYTRNGRHLVLGGHRGHLAAFDWQTKRLMTETNVRESINDVQWLHNYSMFAAAQLRWTYIYDNQGIELHCLKMLDETQCLEYLPYHMLLAAGNVNSFLTYIDISVGQKVAAFGTKTGRINVMCQNPSNAIIHIGSATGTVSLWSPNSREPLVKMLCHPTCIRSMAIDKTGQYMATSGNDKYIKIWDLRKYEIVNSFKVMSPSCSLSFSDRKFLAAGLGSTINVYKNWAENTDSVITSPFMSHKLKTPASQVLFCPYEDVLGVSHHSGFSSLLIPGAGEPNYDALEVNPYESRKHRQHAEVKQLLDKIPADIIALDPAELRKIDQPTLLEKIEQRSKLYKTSQLTIGTPTLRNKKKGKSKTGNVERRRKKVQGTIFKEKVAERKTQLEALNEDLAGATSVTIPKKKKVSKSECVSLSRFEKKTKE